MGKSACECCHHDGYLHPFAFIFVLLLGLTIGTYIMVILLQGIFGGPLTANQVALIIVIACGLLGLLLIIYYAPKRRKNKYDKRDD